MRALVLLLINYIRCDSLCENDRLMGSLPITDASEPVLLVNGEYREDCYKRLSDDFITFDIPLGDCGMVAENIIKNGVR